MRPALRSAETVTNEIHQLLDFLIFRDEREGCRCRGGKEDCRFRESESLTTPRAGEARPAASPCRGYDGLQARATEGLVRHPEQGAVRCPSQRRQFCCPTSPHSRNAWKMQQRMRTSPSPTPVPDPPPYMFPLTGPLRLPLSPRRKVGAPRSAGCCAWKGLGAPVLRESLPRLTARSGKARRGPDARRRPARLLPLR